MQTDECPAYGAALLAGVGADIWVNVQEVVDQNVRVGGATQPNSKIAEVYAEVYPLFKSIYQSLNSDFERAFKFAR